MLNAIKKAWRNIRHLSGDDAYERYLAHFTAHQKLHIHENGELPLSRQAFFKEWQTSKWKGIKRCC